MKGKFLITASVVACAFYINGQAAIPTAATCKAASLSGARQLSFKYREALTKAKQIQGDQMRAVSVANIEANYNKQVAELKLKESECMSKVPPTKKPRQTLIPERAIPQQPNPQNFTPETSPDFGDAPLPR